MIYLATDHRGFELKEKIKAWLTEWGLEYVDCGAMSYVVTDDYPDYIAIAAEKVAQDPVGNRAIILGERTGGDCRKPTPWCAGCGVLRRSEGYAHNGPRT